MFERILKLMREPSTWAGVAGALGGISLFALSTEQWQAVLGAVAAVAGALAAVMLDPGEEKSP